jgi:hypothetical protein
MPRILQVAFVVAFMAVGAFAVSATDQLWQRAVAAYPDSQEWVPFEYEVEQRQVNGRDELVSHSITVSRLRSDGNGGWQPEIVREEIIEGDADQRSPFGGPGDRGEGEDNASDRFAAVSASPLDPQMQDRVTVSRVGRRRSPAGTPAILYEFEIRPREDTRASGNVWLEVDSGMPLRIERTVEPPMMAIKEFSAVQTYEPRSDHWLTTGMQFNVVGRLLFVERRVDVRMELRGHRYDPEVARALQEQRAGDR